MMDEIFFNKESKSGVWEVTSDSSKNVVTIMYWKENDDKPSNAIIVTKKEFLELKSFLSSLRLAKNLKFKSNTKI